MESSNRVKNSFAWYDLVGFFNFSETKLCLFSIDVSGHGISSALLTARLAGYLSAHNKEQNLAFKRAPSGEYVHRDPGEIAAILNARMIEELETELYFTLAFAEIDLVSGLTKFVQAGHPHPVVFNPDSGVQYLGDGGPPIGLMPDLEFETFETTLKPGDRLFLYSDGITECQNAGEELLDEAGLEQILLDHLNGSGPEFINDLMWELTAFANETPFGDDLSAILFEFTDYAVESEKRLSA